VPLYCITTFGKAAGDEHAALQSNNKCIEPNDFGKLLTFYYWQCVLQYPCNTAIIKKPKLSVAQIVYRVKMHKFFAYLIETGHKSTSSTYIPQGLS